jgi:hypothetical protein
MKRRIHEVVGTEKIERELQVCIESGEKFYPIYCSDEYGDYDGRFHTSEWSELVLVGYMTMSEVVSERKRGMAYIWNIGAKGFINYS